MQRVTSVRLRVLALALWLAGVLASAPAEASNPVAESLFQDAVALMKQGKFSEACPKLEASQRREAQSGTLLNLASCREHEGRTATAWAAYKEAAALARAENRRENAEKATELAATVEAKLSRLRVEVAALSPGQEVKVDGNLLDAAVFGVPVPVNPGPHTISATAPRRSAWSVEVTVGKEADTKSISIPALAAAQEGSAAATPAAQSPSPDAPAASGGVPTWAWVVGGAGVAMVAASVIFRVDQADAASTLDHECGEDRSACWEGYDYDADHAREERDFGLFLGFGAAGVVALGVAVVAILTAPPATTRRASAPRLEPFGAVGPSRVGGGVRATF